MQSYKGSHSADIDSYNQIAAPQILEVKLD